MPKIIDLRLRKAGSNLTGAVDPCSECDDKPTCRRTCQRANDWWDEFATKFRRNKTINKLGGV